MKTAVWDAVRGMFQLLRPLREADSSLAMESIDLVDLRGKLRDRLETLKLQVTEAYSERDAYYLLFPLVAHCDELIKVLILERHRMPWPSLQLELYQMEDAGDVFFELLDNLLNRNDTLPLIYEVFFFCLNDGFSGRFEGNEDRLAEYGSRLREHIRLNALPPTHPKQPALQLAPLRIPVWVYYSAAVSLVFLCYWLLAALAHSWTPD